MACRPYRHPDSKRPDVEAALRASTSRHEAASKLGMSIHALDTLCQRWGFSPGSLLSDGRMPFQGKETAQVLSATPERPAPPWQDYRPRAGWTEPEKAAKTKARAEKVTRTIVIADVHVPYHSRPAWSCALGIVRDAKPDRVIVNGDFLEMEALSRHPKSKPDLTRLAEELYAGNIALDEVQEAAGSAEVVYLEGNHEGRAPRFAAEFGQLDGLLSVPVGLYLEPRADYHRETNQLRGIRWIPLRLQPFTLDAVAYLHGVFESMYHAAMTAQHLGPRLSVKHIVSAHMHGWQSFASASGFTSYTCPWLGDETQACFRSYTKGRPRPWHVGALSIEECGDDVAVTPIFIRHGRALFGGRVVEARAA